MVTPALFNPSATTKRAVISTTVVLPKPLTASSMEMTPVAQSARATPSATVPTGSLFQTKTATAAGKEKWRGDAQAAVDAAKASATAAQTAMTDLEGCKRKPKGFAKDMEMLKANWDGLNAQTADLDAKIAAEDFAGAKSAADALKASADTLGADLTAAKDKIKC